MKRRWMIGAGIALLGILGYLIYDRAVSAMAATDYSSWPPNAAMIRQNLGKSDGTAGGETARIERFCELFQNRFRHHDPMMAVGLKPVSSNRLKLMCPARLEPVDIDRISLTAWHETGQLFDHAYDIDIYATFIGMSPIKIGELRPQKDHPEIATIVYNYKDIIVIPPPPKRRTGSRGQAAKLPPHGSVPLTPRRFNESFSTRPTIPVRPRGADL